MSVRHPEFESKTDKEKTPLLQNIQIDMTPINYKGEGTYKPLLKDEYRINGKILNALEEKGLLQCQDTEHNKVENPNIAWNDGTKVVGSTIILSC